MDDIVSPLDGMSNGASSDYIIGAFLIGFAFGIMSAALLMMVVLS